MPHGRKVPEAVTWGRWGSTRIPTVSSFAFPRLFEKAGPLRLATPTLHRLRRQTNMAADHTSPPPLRSLAVFLSRHRSKNARSINSDDIERVILTSWRCDRSRVLPRMCSCGVSISGSRVPGQRALASAVRVGPKVYTFHLGPIKRE
jgi:hypothetical protein